jgi:hypothetical protein
MTNHKGRDRFVHAALMLLEDLDRSGMAVVPVKPSPAMLKAGSLAGGITENATRKVWKAMLSAEG